MAVWTQLAVPVLLVLVALLSGRATISLLQEPALVVSRCRTSHFQTAAG